MKTKLIVLLALLVCTPIWAERVIRVSSPDGQVKLTVKLNRQICYDVVSRGDTLLRNSHLAMQLSDRTLGVNPQFKNYSIKRVSNVVRPSFPIKDAEIENDYNMMTLSLKDGYSVIWRVYNDGVAYRFQTSLRDSIKVVNEDVTLAFAQPMMLTLQQPGGFQTSCEEPYTFVNASAWTESDKISEAPIVMAGKTQKIFFCEYDLHDYPGLFLKGTGSNAVKGIHPQLPTKWNDRNGQLDRSVDVTSTDNCIARTTGSRLFPWRYMVITQDDRNMVHNTMPMRLAPKCLLDDISWIKPGKTTWEWWNGSVPYGPDVNFKSGLNLDTYKYFVDFAAANGIEYILMDEGWAKNTRDPYTPNTAIDLHELIRYAKSKNVGIILWLTWLTADRNMDMFATFEKWGIKGVKIDFMDRQDQWMVNFYERVAKEAANHHLIVDFHGAFHPNGLEYSYPNIVSFEGVRGMENMDFCLTDNSVYFPFVRNAAGIMDYTPGAMLCSQPECYVSRRPNSVSMGTRAYQMALYVLFETKLQMLADNPTLYKMFPECSEFMCQAPVLWDQTLVLAAEYGQYVVVAKRHGNKWYIGGMTNNTPRELDLKLSFLTAGRTLTMTAFEDGPNAARQAMDYRKKVSKVNSMDAIHISMARNGGFAAVIE